MTTPRYDATLARLPLSARLEAKGDAAALAELVAAQGLPFPERPSSLVAAGEIELLRLGRDRVMLLAPLEQEETLHVRLEAAAATHAALAVTLVSDQYQVIELQGPGQLEVIRQGAPLDLSPEAFPPGSATVTELWAIAAILLRRASSTGLTILVERSLTEYLESWLLTAMGLPTDLRPGVQRSPPPRLRP